MNKNIFTNLKYFLPLILIPIVGSQVLAANVYADSSNLFTGCLSTTGKTALYYAQLGTVTSSPCKNGDVQVSADNGDITSVIAGTGLTGGSTVGSAILSLSDGGITTSHLADSAVTVAKIADGSVTNSKIANGSITREKLAFDISSNSQATMCQSCTLNNDFINQFGREFIGAWLFKVYMGGENGLSGLINFSNANFSHAYMREATFGTSDTPVNFTNANFSNANLSIVMSYGENNFTGANFTNANMMGWTTQLTPSSDNYTDAIWSNTICPDGTNSDTNSSTCIGHGL